MLILLALGSDVLFDGHFDICDGLFTVLLTKFHKPYMYFGN